VRQYSSHVDVEKLLEVAAAGRAAGREANEYRLK